MVVERTGRIHGHDSNPANYFDAALNAPALAEGLVRMGTLVRQGQVRGAYTDAERELIDFVYGEDFDYRGHYTVHLPDAFACGTRPEAIAAIRDEIEGSPGEAMTRILRSIGDATTTAPDSYEGTMEWSVAEQVRFMAALGNGQVVSPGASAFLLQQMQPIPSQRWGLGAIGARAFKPGWVSAQTETRQMGIVGKYAVAIITAGEGPATRQSDGDYAHQWQLDRLAALLAERIGVSARS
jgi:hypothetical protein